MLFTLCEIFNICFYAFSYFVLGWTDQCLPVCEQPQRNEIEVLYMNFWMNIALQDGATPLFKAAHKGYAGLVELLVKHGASLGLLKVPIFPEFSFRSALAVSSRLCYNSVGRAVLVYATEHNVAPQSMSCKWQAGKGARLVWL